jgi:hypothetical protein
MRDLIRSPLQFVRPMTEQEWAHMRLRAANREDRRKLRQRARKKSARVTAPQRRIELIRLSQAADSSGLF